jgi:hypothetical protein
MAVGQAFGRHTTHEFGGGGGSEGIIPLNIFEIWSPEMPFPAFWASKFALKFMLTIFVFEIKEGKNAQKFLKILTIIYHYLVLETRRMHTRWHSSFKSILLNKDKG